MKMYAQRILDLYKNPVNKGLLVDETHTHEEYNTSCGDKCRISMEVTNNKIKDIRHSGEGCAISIAAASIFTEEIKGKKVSEVLELSGEDMIKMLGIEVAPARLKCAMIAMSATKRALENVRD